LEVLPISPAILEQSTTMHDIDTFEEWRKHHGYDGYDGYDGEASEDQLTKWRIEFASDMARREAARATVFFSKPPPPGEYRHAVIMEDGTFVLVVSRRFKKREGVWECFVLMQRDNDPDPNEPDWDPHATYHADGTYHQKSFNQKFMVQQRQPLNQFKGSEHLGQFQGMGLAVCNPANFTSVLTVPNGALTSMSGSVLVDLVEPGVLPAASHRQNLGQTIIVEKTYTECSPWVVVAIVKQDTP
jgi:hypothetical protein